MVSRSAPRGRAPSDFLPPTHGILELLEHLTKRQQLGWAVEFLQGADDSDDTARLTKNSGLSFFRISDIGFSATNQQRYATLLIEHVNRDLTSFPVVDVTTFEGRQIQGAITEKGAATCHLVIRLPDEGALDHGRYRCLIEVAPSLSRRAIEHLLCRQLRRVSDATGWTFDVDTSTRKKGVSRKSYRYTPKLELHVDVGRRLGSIPTGRELSMMTFTQRSSRQSIGTESDINYNDFDADVQLKVSAKQGPTDPLERGKWALGIRKYYERNGYETTMSFRYPGSKVASGQMHPAIDGATDLLLCPRELVDLPGEPTIWEPKVNAGTVGALREVLEKDELWEPIQKA